VSSSKVKEARSTSRSNPPEIVNEMETGSAEVRVILSMLAPDFVKTWVRAARELGCNFVELT
jgi:hypothetical protein